MIQPLPEIFALPSDQDATGRTFDQVELDYLRQALDSGVLTSTKGHFTKTFEKEFAELLGVKHARACASGSAAIHIAIAAIDPEPGDEIITTSITDMGALTPIMYQGAIPVFADVDPITLNVTAQSIAAKISPKTKAIIVTHLFGNPAPMTEIMEVANRAGIPVIEDTAQAMLATHDGKSLGTIGAIGCFSLQQGKHITTGEGGVVVSNDKELDRKMYLYINKGWGYGDPKPDHYFLALNYRVSELQGAVALAQLQKLPSVVRKRQNLATAFNAMIADIPGISAPKIAADGECAYWKYALHVDTDVIPGGPVALGKMLGLSKIMTAPRYIVKPAFECEVIRDQKTFGQSHWPFTLARPEVLDYSPAQFPGTYYGLEHVLVLPWNDRYDDGHLAHLERCLRAAVKELMA
jgi:dTDP-4-amino-4,6-dideoxygalactose transaminase